MKKFLRANKKLFTVMITVYLIILTVYGFLNYLSNKNSIMKGIDSALYKSAVTLKYILPEDFHDRATDQHAISIQEDKYITDKLTRFIKETGFKYAYTIVKQGDRLFFVASDIIADPETNRETFYYHPYENSNEIFFKAFEQKIPTYETISDKWSTVRTVMIPEMSPGGISYLSCVDYDASYVKNVLSKALLRSIATPLFFLLLSVPILYIYRRLQDGYAKSLRESEQRFTIAMNATRDGLFDWNLVNNDIYYSLGWKRMLGYDDDELPNDFSVWEELINPEDVKSSWKMQQELISKKRDRFEIEFQMKHKDGHWVDILFRAYAKFNKDGKAVRIVGTHVDITNRKRVEAVSKRNEKLLKLYMEFTPTATAMCDLQMRYLAYSRRWITDYHLPEDNLLGCSHYDLFKTVPEKWKNEHQRCFDGEVIVNEEERFVRADGSVDWVRRNLHPWRTKDDEVGGLIMFTEVVTEKKQAEEEKERLQAQLQQAQKMESIGTLAGGIAHNFNNILMGIQGRTSLMMVNKEFSHPDYEHLQGIEESVSNAVELTRDLLGFARGGRYEVKTTDLNELIKHENKIFGRTNKEISVYGKYDEGLWPVEVDRGQIQQALLNLYVNAWQAMPRGGDLYTQTENIILDDAFVKPFGIAPGRYVKISVADTGTGIDKSILDKIFDPFFTTKDAGQGSGLGLASVYGIINNHGGMITAHSHKGDGATFNIYFPVSEKEIVEDIPKPDRQEIWHGQGTVLLVDDERMIIDVGQKMLECLGFNTMVARSGEEALDLYGRHKHQIDLVILDVIMPGMDGGETYDRLKGIDARVKVLLSSGYSLNGKAKNIIDRGCEGFIQKPFSLDDLSGKIKKMMAGNEA
jgi:PAS domain S-box-containing protein